MPNNIDLSQIHKNLLQCNTGRFRQVYSSHQIIELEKEFRLTNYLPSDRRKVLSKELGLTERQIKIWFQNRRMKLKRTHPDMVVEYVKESASDKKANANNNASQNAAPTVPGENNSSNTHAKSFEDFIREHYERNPGPGPFLQGNACPPAENHSPSLPQSPLELQTKALMEENASKLLLEKLREQTLEKHLREANFPLPPVGREKLTDPNNFPAMPPGQIEKLNDLYDNERNLLIQELIRSKLGLLIQNGRGESGSEEEAPTDLSRKSKSDTEEEGEREMKHEFEDDEDSASSCG